MKITNAFRCHRLLVAAIAGTLLLGNALVETALASEESRRLVQEGYDELQAARYETALEKFAAAAQADSLDGDAFFYQGVTLNRLGRHKAALDKLKWAVELRVQQPEIGFELGWALLGEGQYQAAIEALELYEQAEPGRGQTSEFLGRAHFGLEQYEQAEDLLQQAAQRDPQLKPSVEYYLALIEQRRGRNKAAQQRLRALARDFPTSPLARAVNQGDFSLQAPRPYRFFVALGGGYNSNVIALGDTIPLPSDISRKSSLFATFNAGGSYDWRLRSGATVRAGYSFLADVYEAVHPADLEDHFAYAEYSQTLSSRWRASARLSDEYSRIGGDRFRNRIALHPALAYRHSARQSTELSYDLAFNNYYFPTTPVQNRDGRTHVLALTHYFRPARGRWSARAGLFQVWNQADGADYDFDSTGVFLGASHPLPGHFNGSLFYSHVRARYDNPNSLTGFTARRSDNLDMISLQLTRPLNARTDLYLQATYNNGGSNIAVFDYSQHVLSGGVIARF